MAQSTEPILDRDDHHRKDKTFETFMFGEDRAKDRGRRNMDITFDLIIPVSEKDIDSLLTNLFYIKKFIKCDKLVIISSRQVKDKIMSDPLEFLDEDEVMGDMSYKDVYDLLVLMGGEKRTGWYFQQFLKMAYAKWCRNEYYLVWDADTIPLREITFFDNEKRPFFSLKNEYNKAYFDTIYRLFGSEKCIKGSFIAEHMMFRKDCMLQMIDEISALCPGRSWYKTILSCIKEEQLKYAGFSEFETYGTYVMKRYPGVYSFRRIASFRNGGIYFKEIPSADVLEWIGKRYETISFEKSQKNQIDLDICKKDWFRKMVSFDLYIFICKILKRIRRFQ